MIRVFTFLIAIFIVSPSWAGGIAVVDFQRALQETDEGKRALADLEKSYNQKKDEIERMKKDLESAFRAFQSEESILSNEAKAAKNQKLMEQNARLEQTYMMYQAEIQQAQAQLLQKLDAKMRKVTQAIGKEKGFNLVLDKAVAIYVGPHTKDITDDLISRYNAQ